MDGSFFGKRPSQRHGFSNADIFFLDKFCVVPPFSFFSLFFFPTTLAAFIKMVVMEELKSRNFSLYAQW